MLGKDRGKDLLTRVLYKQHFTRTKEELDQ